MGSHGYFADRRRYKPPPTPQLPAVAPTLPMPTEPSFKWFTREERWLWSTLGKDPNAGWDSNGIPAFTTNYLQLEKMTGEFPDNGQLKKVNKRRIWSTILLRCKQCDGNIAAHWVNRLELTAGYYCDDCHRDYPINSYLLQELNRKPHDAVVSQSHAYLTQNPDFQGFEMFEPGRIAYLGASMGTGKTTAIFQRLAHHIPATAGIVLVPRISLALALADQYRYQHGWDAWGLFHEGSGNTNRYIGTHGAIGCLSALPAILRQAHKQSINTLFIAVDEVDFSYALKNLRPESARVIRDALSEAVNHRGIVVAGQTESLLSLEAFAQEVGRTPDTIKAFYQNASPATGTVNAIAYPKVEGNTNAVRLTGVVRSISNHLNQGKHIYAFFSDRRDVRTLEGVFEQFNPVTYTAYSKGEHRAKALLRHQRLTDSPLFLATSAAAVGINIIDDNAVTVICVNQRFGQRHWKEAVQEALRNRARTDVEIHYTDAPPPLPVKPSEAETTSRYHQVLKQFHEEQPHATDHAARDFALATLADSQPIDYLRYHLEQTAGIPLVQCQAPHVDDVEIETIKATATSAKAQEREAVKDRVAIYLSRDDILTESEIRRRSVSGNMDKLAHLAHERLSAYCQLVGWDGNRTEGEPIHLADNQKRMIADLIDSFEDTATLKRQRRGWLAVHFPELTATLFAKSKADAESLEAEPASVDDDRFLGKVLADLIEGIREQVFTQESLSKRVMTVLTKQHRDGTTYLSRLNDGALGVHTYRQTRFLHRGANTQVIVGWARKFIAEWYPGLIAKSRGKDEYALETHSPPSFTLWAKHRWDIIDSDLTCLDTVTASLSDTQAKQLAVEMRKQGKTVREIARETGLSRSAVERAVKSYRLPSAQERIAKVLADGQPHISQEIIAKAGVSLRTFNLAVKEMGNVEKIKRGIYQIASN